MSQKIYFNAIAAMCDENRGIGLNNGLPWSVPEDAGYFFKVVKTTRDKTKINAVIAGTATWTSLPLNERPIEPCLNIIISSKAILENFEFSKSANPSKILICRSIDEAVNLVREKYADIVETIYAMGGTRIYKDSIESQNFDRFYLTRIFGNFHSDTFIEPEDFLSLFKKIDSKSLTEEEELFNVKYNSFKTEPNNGIKFIFEVYEKIKK